MPTEALNDWKEAARREVERQAFINTSLGPQEFCGPWGSKRDQCHDRQGKWKKEIPYHQLVKGPNAMEVDAVHVQDSTEKNA